MMRIASAVRLSPIHGLGCFTTQALQSGQLVWEFNPKVDRCYRREALATLPPALIAYLRTYAWVNPADGSILFSPDDSKFFNHSAHHNTSMTPDGYGCLANRDIAAGEELTSNYDELPDVPEVVPFAATNPWAAPANALVGVPPLWLAGCLALRFSARR